MKSFKDETKEMVQKYGEDFNEPSSKFYVTKAETIIISEWLQSLVPEILAIQDSSSDDTIKYSKIPSYGAIGGGVTYSFIPTGIGTILIVKESITQRELNVSDSLGFYGF